MKRNNHLNETRLANGLTIISDHMPHVETVALGVWVATGARHEDAAESGISHFIEHMAFKGTKRRNARKIVEEIEEVGGELNAATSLDSTAFYARVLKADIAVALEILADIMLNPTYPGEDLERERNVILQEIAATRDSPEEIVDGPPPGRGVSPPAAGAADSRHRQDRGQLQRRRPPSFPAGPLPWRRHGPFGCR